MGNLFSGWHFLILLAVILLIFGAARLPALAKSVGQSARVFRKEIREMKEENPAAPAKTDDGIAASEVTTPVKNDGSTGSTPSS